MWLKKWNDLPENMKIKGVRRYYDILQKKRKSLMLKRIFDIAAAIITLIILLPLFIVLPVIIKIDSRGPVIYRQKRITRYGKQFRILKFRTMVADAEIIGAQVTTSNDARVTRAGRTMRKYRLDEIPQLLNIISGNMSFVGTRPEVAKYVEQYSDEMMATLLIPAGITSEASIQYMDEENLLEDAKNPDDTYIREVLPEKMEYNLKSIENFSFVGEMFTMVRTFIAVISVGKDTLSEVTIERKDFYM